MVSYMSSANFTRWKQKLNPYISSVSLHDLIYNDDSCFHSSQYIQCDLSLATEIKKSSREEGGVYA